VPSPASESEPIAAALAAAGRLLFVTHARPDGDGLGSVRALALAARAAGRAADVLVPDAVPARYDFLFAGEPPAGAGGFEALADAADAIVIVDTCAFQQLDHLEDGLRKRRGKVLVLDHHATADDVGAVQWIDTSAAAAGVLAAEVIDRLAWPLPASAAEALFIAITSDTGWFHFANTDARCLRVAGRLMEAGLRPDVLYMRLYQCDRPQRLRLMERMLASLELHCGGKLAVMSLRRRDFDETGAAASETENLVNEALRIGSVESAVLLVENHDAMVRVSLRSRDAVDVAAVAERFGGGGHARAAGLRTSEDLDSLKAKLVAAIAKVLN
jgi:phosphoesterase RecJ-like protein